MSKGYQNCQRCYGRGCDSCIYYYNRDLRDSKKERDDTPKPIFTARLDNPKDLKLLRNAIGAEALDRAAQTDDPVREITENLLMASIMQTLDEINLQPKIEIKEPPKPELPPAEPLCGNWNGSGQQQNLF